jgi:hypothetical protein
MQNDHMKSATNDSVAIVRTAYDAYGEKDRSAIERLIAAPPDRPATLRDPSDSPRQRQHDSQLKACLSAEGRTRRGEQAACQWTAPKDFGVPSTPYRSVAPTEPYALN